MTASIALRLLWKEYRVQRGLWLSMAVGALLLQGLISYFVLNAHEAAQGMVPVVFLLTYFYAAGSGAITFSLEREEGTQLRPVMLGCPPLVAWGTKLAFGILATVLLFVLTSASGIWFAFGEIPTLARLGASPETTVVQIEPWMIGLFVWMILLIMTTAFAWSCFFSLLVRKVVVALSLSVAAFIISYIFSAIVWAETFRNRPQSGVNVTASQFAMLAMLSGLVLLLIGVNQLLTHRWLTRAFFDQSSSKSPSFFRKLSIRRAGLDGGMILEYGVEDRTAFDVLTPEEADIQPCPRVGLGWLYWSWGTRFGRHLRFLRWKEALETRKLFVGLLVAALAFMAFMVVDFRSHDDAAGLTAGIIFCSVLACGVMSFRAEHDGSRFQRLADMGLSPRTVWMSKHLVWFSRAVLCLFAAVVVGAIAWDGGRSLPGTALFELVLRVFGIVNPRDLRHSQGDLLLTSLGRSCVAMLGLYSIGQICSLVIRSTIVSAFVAFILAIVGFGWAFACAMLDMPWTISVLPLALGLLLATWLRTPDWMLDDSRPKTWLAPGAAILAAIVICYSGTWLFRVYQIPGTEPLVATVSEDGSDVTLKNGLTEAQREAVVAPVSDVERETARLYQRAGELLEQAAESSSQNVRRLVFDRWDQLSEERQAIALEALSLTLEASTSPKYAAYSPADVIVGEAPYWHNLDLLASLILFDAQRQADNGNLKLAIERCESALALARHAWSRSNIWYNVGSYSISLQVMEELRELASRPDFSLDVVQRVKAMLEEHRQKMVALEEIQFVNLLVARNTIDASDLEILDLVQDESRRYGLFAARRFPGERTRSHRILDWKARQGAEILASYREEQASPGPGGFTTWFINQQNKYADADTHLQKCVQTTPLIAMIDSLGPLELLCLSDIHLESDIRATEIILNLHVLKRQSGEFPATLDEDSESLHNPWTNRPFLWYPKGLPGVVKFQNRPRVEANTPFLMAPGTPQGVPQKREYHVFESWEEGLQPDDEVEVRIEYVCDPHPQDPGRFEPRFWTLTPPESDDE